MWQTLRASRGVYAEFGQSLPELAAAAGRSLMLIVLAAGVILTGAAISTVWRTGPADLPLLLVALAGATAGSLFRLARWPLAAHAFWLASIAAIAVRVIALLHAPEVSAFFVLFPLAAAVLIGWAGALAAEGAVILLCWWLAQAPFPGATALSPLGRSRSA